MPIPVIIVTGFLGCGKTSFLRHLLPMCGEAGLRPALIINEVGDVDVDGELLADLHMEQVKLVGGCVCCTLQSQLKETVFEVLEQERGDCLIIECSGLSNPVDVLHVLTIPALLSRVVVSQLICLVDATRIGSILRAVDLTKMQIATANLVLLNKSDQVAIGMHEEVQRVIDALAPHAETCWTTYGDPGGERLCSILTDPTPVRTWEKANGTPTPHSHNHRPNHDADAHHDHGHAHGHSHAHTHALPASFCTMAFPLPSDATQGAVSQCLQHLPANVIRAKGFAWVDDVWHVLHKVYDTVDITPYSGGTPSCGAVLVCIGQHLEEDAIRQVITEAFRAVPA